MQLRYYQNEAADAVFDRLYYQGDKSTLLVMATGSGKTVIFSEIIKRILPYLEKTGKKACVLAHRTELIKQAVEKIKFATGLGPMDVTVEQANSFGGDFSTVMVASVQTLKGERLERFRKDEFALIIVDEAHHAIAEGYQNIIKHFSSAKVLGVTATPDRLDKKGLGSIFDSVAYVYEVVDGIRDGFLSPIRSRMVVVHSLDLSKVRKIAGDFSEKDLERELTTKPTLWEIAKPTIELAEDRPTLVFGVTVNHARDLAAVINQAKPDSADYLSGYTDRSTRNATIERFRNGEIQFLVNCLLFTEGVDLPFVSCISCARPTQSRALYSQIIGRGMRLHPGKEDCLIIDFTDNSVAHKLVCSLDVLNPCEDQEVRRQAISKLEKEAADPAKILEETEDLIAEKQKAEEKQDVRFKVREVDPFTAIGIELKRSFGGIPPTPRQRDYLIRHGLYKPELTNRQAGLIISKIKQRQILRQCTPRQARILAKNGLNPNMEFDQASIEITKLMDNGKIIAPPITTLESQEW